ncbi:alpha/beta hydrolase [Actinokineospora bangkokensis]|uniref:alpha/beta hydrolase n=1 Tax=Actinokineospora bangkokensis TaxID=1193682 RepID=UPI000AFD4AFA|nr:alpha/beta hydrolase-fold protein [Actinokineospora bangkokensis]
MPRDAPTPGTGSARFTRRTLLAGTAATAIAAAGTGVFANWLLTPKLRGTGLPAPSGTGTTAATATSGTATSAPQAIQTTTVTSTARSTQLELIVIRPEGVATPDLPVCLALHGRGSTARMFTGLGVPAALTAAARTAPFAVVALDGGDKYWTDAGPGDDAQTMLNQELPAWLGQLGLGKPAAVLGISMGAFGALDYARANHPAAVAAVSPALFTSWSEAKARNVFPSRSAWEAAEPLRHTDDLAPTALGVWCGEDDPFAPAARALIDRVGPERAVVGAGAHDEAYWTAVLPDVLAWLAGHL